MTNSNPAIVIFRGTLEAVLPDGSRISLNHPDVQTPVARLVEGARTYAQSGMFAETLFSEFGLSGWELEAVGPTKIDTKQSATLGEMVDRIRERLGGTKRRKSGDTVVKSKPKSKS